MASSSLNSLGLLRKESDEVYYASAHFVVVGPDDLAWMKQVAAKNPRERVRICAHADPASPTHEMLITHARSCYVRPHMHVGKSESFHIMEGSAYVILFDETGNITDAYDMVQAGQGKPFYYRMPERTFHTLLITSDWLIFHETTEGPFDRTKTAFPDWAPDGSDKQEAAEYMHRLAAEVYQFMTSNSRENSLHA